VQGKQGGYGVHVLDCWIVHWDRVDAVLEEEEGILSVAWMGREREG
jgi:hypothetical protein